MSSFCQSVGGARRGFVAVALSAFMLGGCGTSDTDRTAPMSTTQMTPTMSPTTVATQTTTPTTPIRIEDPATGTTPADRLDEAVDITWIGGSDLELEDRSIPDAVAARSPMIGERPLNVFADTWIAPRPDEVAAAVERAAARNVDGLAVILNPSWLSWDGHEECSGITPAHAFYACVLEPRAGTDVASLRDDVRSLVDTIVDTGLPAYVYVIPHSAESLANPELADALSTAELQFAEFDPELDRIEYIDYYLSRDLEPLREGEEFYDMVHPGPAGVERLADHFAAEFVRFFGQHVPHG